MTLLPMKKLHDGWMDGSKSSCPEVGGQEDFSGNAFINGCTLEDISEIGDKNEYKVNDCKTI